MYCKPIQHHYESMYYCFVKTLVFIFTSFIIYMYFSLHHDLHRFILDNPTCLLITTYISKIPLELGISSIPLHSNELFDGNLPVASHILQHLVAKFKLGKILILWRDFSKVHLSQKLVVHVIGFLSRAMGPKFNKTWQETFQCGWFKFLQK